MWEKEIWIAKRTKVETDDFGVDIEYFEKPKRYMLNYQPVSGNTNYLEYGEKTRNVYRAFVDRLAYQGVINIGDRVYLSDSEIIESELEKVALSDDEYCNNANYYVMVMLPQNFKTRIDFMKR